MRAKRRRTEARRTVRAAGRSQPRPTARRSTQSPESARCCETKGTRSAARWLRPARQTLRIALPQPERVDEEGIEERRDRDRRERRADRRRHRWNNRKRQRDDLDDANRLTAAARWKRRLQPVPDRTRRNE